MDLKRSDWKQTVSKLIYDATHSPVLLGKRSWKASLFAPLRPLEELFAVYPDVGKDQENATLCTIFHLTGRNVASLPQFRPDAMRGLGVLARLHQRIGPPCAAFTDLIRWGVGMVSLVTTTDDKT